MVAPAEAGATFFLRTPAMSNEQTPAERLTALRLDYAWKSYSSAASQRTSLLNFFIVIVGVLASAYAIALDKGFYPVAITISIYGLLTTIAFIAFDHRMLVFVNRATHVLETLERESLFPDGYTRLDECGKPRQLGLARIEVDAAKNNGKGIETGVFFTKIKFWQRLVIQGLAGVAFVLAFIYALSEPRSGTATQSTLESRIEALEQGIKTQAPSQAPRESSLQNVGVLFGAIYNSPSPAPRRSCSVLDGLKRLNECLKIIKARDSRVPMKNVFPSPQNKDEPTEP
jgi:hypothetical protein